MPIEINIFRAVLLIIVILGFVVYIKECWRVK